MTWHLKRADGEIFGPVEDEALLQWAREGRILPEDLISTDRQDWIAPSSVETLGMDWFVPMADGTPYGPIHALALGVLIGDGSLGLDDTIAHKTTREIRRVCEVVVPALIGYTASLRDSLLDEQMRREKLEQETKPAAAEDAKVVERLRSELVIARGASEEREKEIERLKQQLAASIARAESKASEPAPGQNVAPVEEPKALERARAELKEARKISEEHEKEVVRLKHLVDDESARARQREIVLQQKIKELQESEIELLKSLDAARGKTALAERKIGGGSGGSDYSSLVQSYDDLSKNYDLLMEQFTAKAGDLSAAYAAIEKLKKETEERVARIEETMRAERADADTARQRLAKAEEAHLELVRSYRELNDRHIRYRQKMEGPVGKSDAPVTGEVKPKVRLV